MSMPMCWTLKRSVSFLTCAAWCVNDVPRQLCFSRMRNLAPGSSGGATTTQVASSRVRLGS